MHSTVARESTSREAQEEKLPAGMITLRQMSGSGEPEEYTSIQGITPPLQELLFELLSQIDGYMTVTQLDM